MAYALDRIRRCWVFAAVFCWLCSGGCALRSPETTPAVDLNAAVETPRVSEAAAPESADPKIRKLRAALAKRPKDAELMRELAETWMERGNEAKAVDWLRQATARAPGDAELWVRLGDVEERGRRYGAAIRALDRALEIEPAWIEVARRRDDLAERLAEVGKQPQVSAGPR